MTVFFWPYLEDRPKGHLTLGEGSTYYLPPMRAQTFYSSYKTRRWLKAEMVQWFYFLSDRNGISNACFNCPLRHITKQSLFQLFLLSKSIQLLISSRKLLWLFAESLTDKLSKLFTDANYFYENFIFDNLRIILWHCL